MSKFLVAIFWFACLFAGSVVMGQGGLETPAFTFRDSGLASIWTQQKPLNEERSEVRVIQGFMNWEMLEPSNDNFNWTALDNLLSRAESLNKTVMLQINGNAPEWISNYVPYLNFNSRGIKAHQFWHPVYIDLYSNLLDAFAERISNDPRKKWVIGVRIQPNAFNTEAYNWAYNNDEAWNQAVAQLATKGVPNPANPADTLNWVVPAGVTIHKPLMEKTNFSVGDNYYKEIISIYKNAFHSREIHTFCRLEILDSNVLRPWLESNYWTDPFAGALVTNLGVWQGGTRTLYHARHVTSLYNVPLYTEDVLSAEEKHRAPTKEQEIYWRQILKLHTNVTYSATYMEDLDEIGKLPWDEGFEMINRYAGMHKTPWFSSGGFIVFAYWSAVGEITNKVDNVSLFLKQSNAGATSNVSNIGLNTVHYGYKAKSLISQNLEIGMDPDFANAIRNKNVQIRVTYFEKADAGWDLYVHNGTGLILCDNKLTQGSDWKTNIYNVSSAGFPGNGINDIVLQRTGSVSPVFHKIEIMVNQEMSADSIVPQAPVDVETYSTETKVDINWSPNTENDVIGYNVYRTLDPSTGFTRINSLLVNISQFTDSNITVGTNYYYTVTAIDNSLNESLFSDTVLVQPVSEPGEKKIFVPVADGSLNPGFTGVNLRVENANAVRVVYLKFSISGVYPNSITRARLKLFCNGDGGSGTINVYQGSHNNWSESNTTNLPVTTTLLGSITGDFTVGRWFEWNFDPVPQFTDEIYTFIVKHESAGNDVWFDSRETSNSPELILTVDNKFDITAPAVPFNLSIVPGELYPSLDWNDNQEADLVGYNIYRSQTDGSGYVKINTEPVPVSYFTDDNVSKEVYYYVVTSVDTAGNESGFSVQVYVNLTYIGINLNEELFRAWFTDSGLEIRNNPGMADWIRLMDINGRTIFCKTEVEAGNNSYSIKKAMNAGLYLLQVYSSGSLQVFKLMKN